MSSKNKQKKSRLGVTEHKDINVFGALLMISQFAVFTNSLRIWGGEVHTIVSPFLFVLPQFMMMLFFFCIFLIVPCFFNAVMSLQCSHLMYLIQM